MKNVVAIGNFDGYHRGHQKIFREISRLGFSEGYKPLALTFEPNPRTYFNLQQKLIFTEFQKVEALKKLAQVEPVVVDFSEIVGLTPEQFINKFLVEKLDAAHVVVGSNFKFGYSRSGDAEYLKSYGKKVGFRVSVLEPVQYKDERISSSRIRTLLQHGEVGRAAKMLGRDYYIDGVVVNGEKIGREIGFPTLNIDTQNSILPGGVFDSKVEFGGRSFRGVTNIGVRPTFRGNRFTVETHIPNFCEDLYGSEVRLFLCRKLRNEKAFDTREELVAQIKKDIACLQS